MAADYVTNVNLVSSNSRQQWAFVTAKNPL